MWLTMLSFTENTCFKCFGVLGFVRVFWFFRALCFFGFLIFFTSKSD